MDRWNAKDFKYFNLLAKGKQMGSQMCESPVKRTSAGKRSLLL